MYRIKSYSHTDPGLVNSQDYIIFQIELLDIEVQNFYKGSYILEIWTKSGDRIFSRVLKEECKY